MTLGLGAPAILAPLLFLSVTQAGEDWPCWRGPRGDGAALESGWELDGPVLWERDVGLGHSESSIAEGRLFTLGFHRDRGEDVVRCIDAAVGELLWSYSYPATLGANGHPGGTLTTPAVRDGVAVTTNRTGSVHAFEATRGDLLWSRDLRRDHGAEPNDYGFGGSPVFHGDAILLNASRSFALDRETGETLWQSADHRAMYSTPTLFTLRGEVCVATFTKEGLWLLDADDGSDLQHVPWQKGPTRVNASAPVVVGERIFFSSGYNHGCALVEFPSDGARIVFENKRMRTRLSGCTLFGAHLFGFDESVLKCLDLEGRECWRKRGLGLGSLRVAGDRLLLLTDSGELVTARATADGFEELARESVFEDGGVYWSAPVLSHGLLYLRSSTGRLICQDRRADGDPASTGR